MTPTERRALLLKVAEVAPKDLDCFLYDGVLGVGVPATHYMSVQSDVADAAAIVAMLDAIEQAGYLTELHGSRDGYSCLILEEYTRKILFEEVDTDGDTRAEAVARAFIAVFGKEKA